MWMWWFAIMVHGTPSIVPGLQEVVLIKQGEGCQWVDASQSLHRCRGSKDESVVPTLLPGTNFWSVALQRSVLGKDALALQGLYHDCFDELFLGRKPCSLPVWFVVFLVLWNHRPWNQPWILNQERTIQTIGTVLDQIIPNS